MWRWIFRTVLIAACMGCSFPAVADDIAPLAQLQQRVFDVAEQTSPAVVSIALVVLEKEDSLPPGFDPFNAVVNPGESGPVAEGFGSGVVLRADDSQDLLVLTNHHVITSQIGFDDTIQQKIFVRTVGGHTLEAVVHAFDPRSDLAVLRCRLNGLTAETLKIQPPTFREEPTYRKGEFVLVLGNPLAIARDGNCSVAWGMISNISRRPAGEIEDTMNSAATIHQLDTLLQIDARLPLGMSGGAVLDLDGHLIGLTTSLAAGVGDANPAGFAIPLDAGMQRVVETLLKGEEVEYGFLGIDPEDSTVEDLRLARPFVTQATCVHVSRVATRSPAALCDLREGDLVYKVNGTEAHDRSDLIRLLGLLGPEAEARLSVYRPSTRQFLTRTAILGKWPMYDDRRLVVTNQKYANWRGLRVDYATGRFRYLPDGFLSTYPQGVIVTTVSANSAAAQADIGPGTRITEIAGKEVFTPHEFYAAIDGANGPVELLFANGERRVVPEPGIEDASQSE
ncbi:MAG: trypsin-like peptidase domain-containing protein [Planctomycetaceae bacterium]|nr:trypsin-like peptidase domain-containing protein [Planctomycetaceae bacterium]